MIKKTHIFLEGKADLLWISMLLEQRLGFTIQLNLDDLTAKGKNDKVEVSIYNLSRKGNFGGLDSKKITSLMKEIQSLLSKGINSLVIIDCDTPEHKHPPGGYALRKSYFDGFDVKFGLFLVPNNSSDGNLESLLSSVIAMDGRPFYDCLDCYFKCIRKIGDAAPEYFRENNISKMKMSIYQSLMTGKSANAGLTGNAALWDLNAKELEPLLEFLKSHIF